MPANKRTDLLADRWTPLHLTMKNRNPITYEVVTNVGVLLGFSKILWFRSAETTRLLCQRKRFQRDIHFGEVAVCRNVRNRLPVVFTAFEIHLRVGASRITAHHSINHD